MSITSLNFNLFGKIIAHLFFKIKQFRQKNRKKFRLVSFSSSAQIPIVIYHKENQAVLFILTE